MPLTYKRHFPADWPEEKILDCVTEIITNPKISWKQITGMESLISRPPKFIADGKIEDKMIRVIFEPEDRWILTAYPLN